MKIKIFILIALVAIACLLLFGRAKADNRIAFRQTDSVCLVNCIQNGGYSYGWCVRQCNYDSEE